jgi:DNA replication ATP-dependent helicase Dna2
MMRASNDVSPALVWGNMLHDVMQSCLSSGRWDEAWIESQIEEVIRRGLIELYKIDVTVEVATRELRHRAHGLRAFAEKYIGDNPKAGISLPR